MTRLKPIFVSSLFCFGLFACQNQKNNQTPIKPKTATKTQTKTETKTKTTPLDPDTCVPYTQAKPMHEAFSCIHESLPPERLIILRSHGDLRRFISRMPRSCELPEFDFKTYSLLLFKGTASCSVQVNDKLCKGNPLRYEVDLMADGFCSKLAAESRFWQIPKLSSDQIVEFKRTRSRAKH